MWQVREMLETELDLYPAPIIYIIIINKRNLTMVYLNIIHAINTNTKYQSWLMWIYCLVGPCG